MTPRPLKKSPSTQTALPSQKQKALLEPHVTEKATAAERLSTYVFKVAGGASKIEIGRAVAARFKVKVSNVRVSRIPGKTRRVGRTIGQKAGYKKAYVTLKKGETITSR